MTNKLYGYLLLAALGFVVIVGPLIGVWVSGFLEKRERKSERKKEMMKHGQ